MNNSSKRMQLECAVLQASLLSSLTGDGLQYQNLPSEYVMHKNLQVVQQMQSIYWSCLRCTKQQLQAQHHAFEKALACDRTCLHGSWCMKISAHGNTTSLAHKYLLACL